MTILESKINELLKQAQEYQKKYKKVMQQVRELQEINKNMKVEERK